MSLLDDILSKASQQVNSNLKSAARKAKASAKNTISKGVDKAVAAAQTKKETFTFEKIPETVEEFKALPEAAQLTNPYATAALTILAYAAYSKNSEEGIKMFNVLRGPVPFSNLDIQRTKESIWDGEQYIPMSYFEGATVDNNYTPAVPYKVTITSNSHSDDNLSSGYKRLFVRSAGADSERYMVFRTKASTKEWFLTEHSGILLDIRKPKAADPWA